MFTTKSFLAALCSLVLPGAGQTLAGRWRRGLLLLGSVLAILGTTAAVLLRGAASPLALLVHPTTLLVLLGVNAAVLGLRLFAVIDAYRLCRLGNAVQSRWSWGSLLLLGILLGATSAPHLVVGYYNLQAYSVLTTVFTARASAPVGASVPVVSATVSATPLPTATPTSTPVAPTSQPAITMPDDLVVQGRSAGLCHEQPPRPSCHHLRLSRHHRHLLSRHRLRLSPAHWPVSRGSMYCWWAAMLAQSAEVCVPIR